MNRENIRFNVLRNALYHTSRRLTLERWNRWLNFGVVLSGAAAMSDLITRYGVDQKWVGAVVAVLGAIQLVFDFGQRARDHQNLQREYYNLLSDIDADIEGDERQLAVWYGRMTRIAGDEPPTMRAIDARAYNDAIGATEYYGQEELVKIPFNQSLFGNFWAFEGYHYLKRKEINAKGAPASFVETCGQQANGAPVDGV